MCFPGAPIALAAAQGMASFASQQSQYAAQEAQFNTNYQNALSDNRDTENSLQAQEMEANASYAQKDNLALIQEAEKEAQVRTSAATAGVAGNTVNDLVNGIGEQVGLQRSTLETNWQSATQQTQSEKIAGVSQETSRIGEVANPYEPSPVGTLLGVAAAGVSYGNTSSGANFFSSLGSGASSTNSGGAGLNVINTPTTNGLATPGP